MYRYKVRKVLAFVFSLSIVCLNALPLGVSADSNSETTTSVTQSVDTTTKAVTEKTKDAEVTTTAKTSKESILKKWQEFYGDSLISAVDYAKLSVEDEAGYIDKYVGKGGFVQESTLNLMCDALYCPEVGFDSIKVYVNDVQIDNAFSDFQALKTITKQLDSNLSLKDKFVVKLTNVPDMVSYVECNGKSYYNQSGVITIDLTITSDNTTNGLVDLYFDDELNNDVTIGQSSSTVDVTNELDPDYYAVASYLQGTSENPFEIYFYGDNTKVLTYIMDENDNLLKNAELEVQVSYTNDDGGVVVGNTQYIKTNDKGYALVSLVDGMSRSTNSCWYLYYTITYNDTSSLERTKSINYTDLMPTVYLTYKPSTNTYDIYEDEYYDNVVTDEDNNVESKVLVNTSFSNVDGSFVELSGVSVTFTNSMGDAGTYYLDDFDGISAYLLKNETYTVTYNSEDYSYFKIFGPSTFTTSEDESTFTVSLEAKYVLEIHKVVDGKEVAWNFINPLTGETISGTGIKKYAVANGVNYEIEDVDTGEVYLVGVNADESGTGGTLLDLYTGETSVTSATDNVFAIPQTGDALTIALTSLGVIGAAGASYFVYNKKKKDKLDSSSEESDYDEI